MSVRVHSVSAELVDNECIFTNVLSWIIESRQFVILCLFNGGFGVKYMQKSQKPKVTQQANLSSRYRVFEQCDASGACGWCV